VTAVILLGLVALFYALGRDAFFGLVMTVVLIAQFELLDALVQSGHRPNTAFALMGGAAMMTVAFLQRPAFFGVVLAATMLGAFAFALRPRRGESPASDVAWTMLSVAWVGGGGAGAVMVLMSFRHGLLLLITLVLVAALDDILAYFSGSRFGAHKLAPSISPAKSWEGFAGGSLGALAGGALLGAAFGHLSALAGLGLGAVCAVAAPIGDLVESIAKRELGIKDSGRLLPGHGGLLDRLDAIIFCAPAVFLYLRFVVG
jgi:phosphatidate cytidylyltransferase